MKNAHNTQCAQNSDTKIIDKMKKNEKIASSYTKHH